MSWVEVSKENKEKIKQSMLKKPFHIMENGKDICIVKTEEGIWGMQNSCPHAGAQLHHGYCNKLDIISCPLHGYKFYIKNGRSADGNNYKLTAYELKIEEENIFIRAK